jgi:hypothetical protein
MSSANRNISDALTKIVGLHKVDPIYYGDAIIESVDLPNCICSVTVVDGLAEVVIPNVRLMTVTDDGVLIEPVVGSTVTILYSQNVDPVIVQYSEIASINITSTKFSFNGGELGGLIKSDILTQKLNNLETKFNTMLVWAATVTPPFTSQPLILTQSSELQNKSVTHGY